MDSSIPSPDLPMVSTRPAPLCGQYSEPIVIKIIAVHYSAAP